MRAVAQLGRAHAWGAWGRRFESGQPDSPDNQRVASALSVDWQRDCQPVRRRSPVNPYIAKRRALLESSTNVTDAGGAADVNKEAPASIQNRLSL
jgi:hypothetical protein